MFQLTLCILKPDIVRVPTFFQVRDTSTANLASTRSFLSCKETIELIVQHRFLFLRTRMTSITREQAAHFYREHQGLSLWLAIESTLDDLLFQANSSTIAWWITWVGQIEPIDERRSSNITFDLLISSGPISCHVLGRENAIQHWRALLGPTKVFRLNIDRSIDSLTHRRIWLSEQSSKINKRFEVGLAWQIPETVHTDQVRCYFDFSRFDPFALLDSIDTARREIQIFFPDFDFRLSSKCQEIPFDRFNFDRNILQHRLLDGNLLDYESIWFDWKIYFCIC